MIINIPKLSLLLYSFAVIFISRLSAKTFKSPLLDPAVTSSPAYISLKQFNQAVNASLPYLYRPLTNGTIAKLQYQVNYTYPDFLNTAISIGNITNKNEMAMYLAQVLYQSNGLQKTYDPMCKNATSTGCMSLNLNATVHGVSVNYYGRGYLWLQGRSAYQSCVSDLFGNDSTMLMYPDSIRIHPQLSWAVSAWMWKQLVQPHMSTFGSTVKLLRPTQCTGSSETPAPEAQAAWNIYAEILKILQPTSGPSSSFC